MNRITKIVHPEIEFEKWIRKETNYESINSCVSIVNLRNDVIRTRTERMQERKKMVEAHWRACARSWERKNFPKHRCRADATRCSAWGTHSGKTGRNETRANSIWVSKKETDDERRREELSGFGERNFEISRNAKVAGTRNNRTPGSALLFACQMCKQKQQQTQVDCNLRSNCWTITRVENKYQLYVSDITKYHWNISIFILYTRIVINIAENFCDCSISFGFVN